MASIMPGQRYGARFTSRLPHTLDEYLTTERGYFWPVLINPANRLVILSAMRWFPTGLVVPVLILMLGARGLPLNQVGQVMALYSVVTLSLELPTGGLADAWGRKPVIVASAVMQGLGLLLLTLFGNLSVVLIAIAVLGAARALSSGPVESWFVDSLVNPGPGVVESGLARGQIAESLALGAGAVVGGLLPALGVGLPAEGDGFIALSIPFAVAAAMTVAFAVAALLLITSQKSRVRTPVGSTVSGAVRQAVGDAPLRRVLLVAVCLGVLLSGVELLAPNAFADLLGGTTEASGLYGALTAAAFGFAAAGAALSTRLPGRRAKVAALAFLVGAGLVTVISVPHVAVAAIAFLGFYIVIGVQGPVMAGLLHSRVQSRMRSTMMSVESLALQAGGAVASLVVGALAARVNLLAGFGFIAAAAVVGAMVLLRDLRDRTTGGPETL